MSQNDFNIANQGFPATRADINSALQALASNSAGTAEPSTTYAYQFWYDETNELLKMRNSDNDAWITIGTFDQVADTFTPAGVTTDKIEEGNSSVEVVDTGTGYVAITVDGVEAARVDTNGRLGIGTSSPATPLEITTTNKLGATFTGNVNGEGLTVTQTDYVSGNYISLVEAAFDDSGRTSPNVRIGAMFDSNGSKIAFGTSNSFGSGITNTAMLIDSSGNLLVGKTSANSGVEGFEAESDGKIAATRDGARAAIFNRLTSDGEIVDFRKDGTTVGSIGATSGDMFLGTDNTGLRFVNAGSDIRPFDPSTTSIRDDAIDLGDASARFDDVYATNGTIQTSDRNEKQDIAELDEAERRVAVAAKGLIRKFRWKDAVAEKGDDARIHFGIIAQDLQAAFEAEGLDAARYGMFISSTWWEAERVIPAVKAVAAQDAVYETVVIPAVLDEDGNEIEPERTEQVLVSEAVEAVEAQPERTVTDTYQTQEEAPEGAVERTRMGVRYPELLAFIIAAI